MICMGRVVGDMRRPVMNDRPELEIFPSRLHILLLQSIGRQRGRPGASLGHASHPLMSNCVSIALDSVEIITLEKFLVIPESTPLLHDRGVCMNHGVGVDNAVGIRSSCGHAYRRSPTSYNVAKGTASAFDIYQTLEPNQQHGSDGQFERPIGITPLRTGGFE